MPVSSQTSAAAAIFDPERLTLARQLRRKQQKEVADCAGVTPASISQYEGGHAKPSPETLGEIARCLKFPPEFFGGGRQRFAVDEDRAAHFRSLRRTPKRDKHRALAHAELAREVVAALQQHMRLPDLDIPDQPIDPELPVDEIERIAEWARDELGIPTGPVANMVHLLERHGVVVSLYHAGSLDLDAFSYPFADHPILLLAVDKEDLPRARFNAAHELGHLVLHRESGAGGKKTERQAHRFAGAFLLPADEITDAFPSRVNWDVLLDLKYDWGVSMSALLYRAKDLGMMSPSTYRRAMMAMSSRNWHKDEPGDLGPLEKPIVLPRAIELLAQHGTTIEDLADQIHAPVSLVEEIVYGPPDQRPAVEI